MTATTEAPDGEPVSAACRVTVVSEDIYPPCVPDQGASQRSGGGRVRWLVGVDAGSHGGEEGNSIKMYGG